MRANLQTFTGRIFGIPAGLLLIAAGASALAATPSDPSAGRNATFIQVGRLLADPASGRVDTQKTLVIADGKVLEVRDGFHSGGAETLDLRASFVLPGLIDSHVHLTNELGPDTKLDLVTRSDAQVTLDSIVYARRTLEAGFTTVWTPVPAAMWFFPCAMASPREKSRGRASLRRALPDRTAAMETSMVIATT